MPLESLVRRAAPARVVTARALVLVALGAGCEIAETQTVRTAVVGRFANAAIRESSGVVRSLDQPGVFWTINDSGNDPLLFAFDSTGRDLGTFRVAGARNQDWESLGIGRCLGDGKPATCLYIGETGDNEERRPTRAIYRVPEPRVGANAGQLDTTATARRLVYTYDDRPHDVEGIFVSGDGAVHMITKGRSGGILHFRLPAAAWDGDGRAVAARVDSLPIVPHFGSGRTITDAALAPDGRHLAVRTYREVYLFRADSATGAIDRAVAPAACNIRGLRERGGEGLTWLDARGLVMLTAEGKAGTISVAECPLPSVDP